MTNSNRNNGSNMGRNADGALATGSELTPKQGMFVKEYLISLNASDAARKLAPRVKCENELMAKPKPKITAKEKKAREYRRAFERICDRIAAGESVRQITADKKVGLSESGFYNILQRGDEALVEHYARAREIQAVRMAEEILEIADDATNDFIEKRGKDGRKKVEFNSENVNRSRLRIDTRKWLAGKLKPKVYGEKQTVDVNQGLLDMDDTELSARAKQLADRLGITLPPNLLKPAGHGGDGG